MIKPLFNRRAVFCKEGSHEAVWKHRIIVSRIHCRDILRLLEKPMGSVLSFHTFLKPETLGSELRFSGLTGQGVKVCILTFQSLLA